MTTPAGAARPSFEEMFARLDASDDTDGGDAFLDLILESAARRDSELPDLVRACAVPRRITADVIGVLRGRADDAEGNTRYLDLLGTYRFVLPRPDGGFVYHDNTRDTLLAEWRSDDRRARFDELNRSLSAYYEGIHRAAVGSARDLTEVSALILRVNPGRLRRLRAAIEQRMTAGLLEALYHHLLVGAEDGFTFFKDSFFDLEEENRVSVCQAMISLARDHLQRQDPVGNRPTLQWLDYFETRTAQRTPGYDPSLIEATLDTLASDAVAPDLRLWALGDLATVYEAQLKVDLALRARQRLTDADPSIDAYNRPLRHQNLAALYNWRSDSRAAVEQYRLAMAAADGPEARTDTAISARLEMSVVLGDLGDWPGAFDTALDALIRAKTQFRSTKGLQRQVATTFAKLLGSFDAAASDTAAEQALVLLDPSIDRRAPALTARLEDLLQVDRVQAAASYARRWAAELDAGVDDGDVTQDLRLRQARARLATFAGEPDRALDLLGSIITESQTRPDAGLLLNSTLMLRGIAHTSCGRVEAALADLVRARDWWAAHGFPVDAATSASLVADALTRAGRPDEATSTLDAVDPASVERNLLTRIQFAAVRGDIARAGGEWAAARGHYRAALTFVRQRRETATEASLCRRLAAVHGELGEWAEAAECDAAAAAASARLAEADAVVVAEPVRRATAEATVTLDRLDGRRRSEVARQLFGQAAADAPDNFWLALELYFVCEEQQDRPAASEALTRALSLAPEPVRSARLYRLLRDAVQAEVAWLFATDDVQRAAAAATVQLPLLAAALPAAELAELHAIAGIVHAVGGDAEAAGSAWTAALEAEPGVAAAVSGVVTDPTSYWAVDDVLAGLTDCAAAPGARATLARRLEVVLNLDPGAAAQELASTTPIVVEVGDAVVPFVDATQDDGVFIYQLIPAMREGLHRRWGVEVPGVRLRSDPARADDGYLIQIDESPVAAGVLGATPSGAELIDRIESILELHLARLVGIEDATRIVAGWAETDPQRVAAVLPDAAATARLTWVLQDLLDDHVPIVDGPAILDAIRAAGGIDMPVRNLLRAARAAIGIRPTIDPATRTVPVPAELEAALLAESRREDGAAGSVDDPPALSVQLRFRTWLQGVCAEDATPPALVTSDDYARELVAALARSEDRRIRTVTAAELSGGSP